MSSVRPSAGQNQTTHAGDSAAVESQLSTLIYRSRATAQLTERELHRMLDAARDRNHAAAVTGLLIYDNGKFFQWLEGPADAVTRIWESIRSDARHTDIEILGDEPVLTRVFGDWDMKLALRHPPSDGKDRETLETPPGLIESLNRNPRNANYFLATLAPVLNTDFAGYTQAARRPQQAQSAKGSPSPSATQELQSSRSQSTSIAPPDGLVPFILQRVIGSDVIPALVRRHPQLAPDLKPGTINPAVAELARRLIASEPDAAFELIDKLQTGASSIAQLCANSLEPAARALGDMWSNDDCTDLDVSLGINQMQMAVRRGNIALVPIAFDGTAMPAVLVATQPGEMHSLSATLDAEVLWHDGWDIHCERPESDEALNDMVAEHWFDALDLSLSTAFRHEDWLPRMTETIAQARKASRNPSLVVVVGGRMFHEQQDAWKRVGADAGVTDAQHVGPTILEALRKNGD